MGHDSWGIIWLRTCYDEGSDEGHQKLLCELNEELALDVDENMLDDATLYDYGDNWRRIFEVVPERLLEAMNEVDGMPTPEEREARIRDAQRNTNIDEAADTEAFRQATARLHARVIYKYLFVADKVALDTGRVLVIFYDDCGRVVRQSRVRPERGEQLSGAWFEVFVHEIAEFEEVEVGPDYLPGGSCGPPYAT